MSGVERGASAAVERLGRLLSLVPYLLARPGARVSDVARTFGVSEDQLVRDLQLVWMCGLPGYLPCDLIDVNIEGGEIDLSNADTIARPLRLGVDEALALLVGLRALAEIPGLHDRDALRRTIAKLERAAGDAAALSGHVAIEFETKESVLTAVRVGLDRGRRLHLDYYVPVRDERTERTVDPMRVVFADGRSYLEAWCHRAEGVRLFRLDRVLAVTILDEPAHVPREAAPLDLDAGLFRPSPDDLLVTLEVAPPGRWVAEYYPYESAEEIDGGGLRLRLRTPDPAWARRLALRLGPSGRVVDPPALVESIREAATRALAAYDQPR